MRKNEEKLEGINRVELKQCDPKEILLKSFFLGPQAENGVWIQKVVTALLGQWIDWRRNCFPGDGVAISNHDRDLPEFRDAQRKIETTLEKLMLRFEAEVPKFSPRYMGHMTSEISLPALLGHVVALLHNPNNISGESSIVGVKVEDEALKSLQEMLGFAGPAIGGHFTSGGTIANFEALVRARSRLCLWLSAGALLREAGRELSMFAAAHLGWDLYRGVSGQSNEVSKWGLYADNPWKMALKLGALFQTPFLGPVVLVPENKHYSWKKGVSLFGMGDEDFWGIQLDQKGRLSIPHLKALLERAEAEQRPVAMVVSVLGSTELGTIDPVNEVQDVIDQWAKRGIHIWHHVDAAYGGFFCSLGLGQAQVLNPQSTAALLAVSRVNSVTLDPHKLGYVPYSSGAVLVHSNEDYWVKSYEAPYLQYSMKSDRGPYTIEGSRSAAGAVATWMTAQTIGLNSEGYGRILERTIRIKKSLESALVMADPRIRVIPATDTNILAFTVAAPQESMLESNARAHRIYDALSPIGKGGFVVSKTSLHGDAYPLLLDSFLGQWEAQRDCTELTLVRVCVMNPFFEAKEMAVDFEVEFVKTIQKLI